MNVDAVFGGHDRVFVLAGCIYQEDVVLGPVDIDAFVESVLDGRLVMIDELALNELNC